MQKKKHGDPAKTKPMGAKLITAGCITLAVLAAGSRFYFDTFANDAAARSPEAEKLASTLESLHSETIASLDSDPDAMVRFYDEQERALSSYRASTSPTDSLQAFMADFVLTYNGKAPDEDVMISEWDRIMDLSTIATPADLVERQQSLRTLEQMSLEMIAWLEAIPAELEAALSKTEFSERSKRKAKKGTIAGLNLPARTEIQQLDRQMYRVVNDMLMHLRSSWGSWTYDTESDMVQFNNEADIAVFNAHVDSLDRLIERQSKIQNDLFMMYQNGGR